MSYKKSPFKMAPKSPLAKALKGNQSKLPQQLQDAIKAAPESPAKQTKKAHTDEMGREGHFNPYTERTRGASSPHASVDTQYPSKYQNKILKPTSRESGYAKKAGYQEEKMRSGFKSESIMGLRADAYTAKENNFGIKKPKANIKSPAQKYKK